MCKFSDTKIIRDPSGADMSSGVETDRGQELGHVLRGRSLGRMACS